MLADCCHSGALYDECRRRNRADGDRELAFAATHFVLLPQHLDRQLDLFRLRCSPASAAKARSTSTSTASIELNELAHYTDLELAFLEGQKSMFYAAKRFPRAGQARLRSKTKRSPRVGQRLEVESKGRWYKAKIIDVDGDQVEVHYAGFDDTSDEWVGPDRTRPYSPAQFAPGDRVEVQWERRRTKWYPATVDAAWYGLHRIHYDERRCLRRRMDRPPIHPPRSK